MANSWASDVVVLPVANDFSMVIVLPLAPLEILTAGVFLASVKNSRVLFS